MRETFVFPHLDALLKDHGEERDDKIVVVSIIGKTALNSNGLKLKSLGRMFTSNTNRTEECTIEACYDEENQIVYLHVHSLLDTDNFIRNYDSLVEGCDFLTAYDKVKSSYVKALFTLFYVSHIVILSHPSHTFDLNYLQYFKAMELMDQKLLGSISNALKEIKCISDDWITAGRPATPRVIFYFERCPRQVVNIKKFEHNIEDKIYQILRKTRIINSSKPWSLFAIPMNEEFVFVSKENPPDRLGQAVRRLIMGCQRGKSVQVKAPFCSESNHPRNFQSFLRQHIKQARIKGFDDVQGHFELFSNQLPSLLQWIQASKAIFAIVNEQKIIKELSMETRFSEQRCGKCLPMAFARYQEGMSGGSACYTSTMHKSRLEYAMVLFRAQARGPMFQRFSQQLVLDCQAYWEAGRQLCEAPSLTGNPCTLRKDHPADQEHSSGVKYIAVCDCGRKQGARDDPYNAKEANFTFYQNLAKECGCSKHERITFPTFENKEVTEYLPGMLTTSSPAGLLPEYQSWALICLGASSLYSHNLGLAEIFHPGFWATTNYLLPWDVVVYSKTMPSPTSEEQDTKKWAMKRRDIKLAKWMSQFAVKLFIGFEYECHRGHRFMLAAPDKILTAAPGSIVKDKGQKVAESDMPLYFSCLCTRGAKPMTAQLMRIHIVTPKAAVRVKVNPRVQPSSGAPIFVPSLDGPATLTQAAYWVLRLPYVYFSDKKNYLESQTARLLSGLFTVKKIE